ncbi:retrovirus-related pol polyprotein from transposon TNT 1-94 [Tanacetum coccineum]
MQQPLPNNNFIPQPSFNTNYMQQLMLNPKDITDPTTAINMELVLMAKAFKLNYSTPTNNNQRISSNLHNRQIAQPGNGNGNGNGNNGNQVRCYNCRGIGHYARNCTVRPRRMDAAYLQTQLLIAQKEEAKIQLQDEEFDLMAVVGDLDEIDQLFTMKQGLEYEIERLLKAVVSQHIMSTVQSNSIVDTSNLQYKKCEECKYDKISYDKAYNDMQQKIERVQAQLGDFKGKSQDTSCVSDAFDPLSQKLEDKNVSLGFPVLNYAKENEHLKTTYKNLFDYIKVTRAQTKLIADSLQDKLHDTIYENTTLRAQLFDKVSEQNNTNKGIDNTAKTRRPQPRSNTKNHRVPSASKSSWIKNKEVKVEEYPRNLMLSKNKKHMSSEFINIKLSIQNDKYKVICAMCKQCLITYNHDVCVLNYVNDMHSRVNNFNANVLNTANKKKHKPKVSKPKKVGSKERLASPKPRKPRTCLRWSPTGRMFDLKGKIVVSNKSECQSDTCKDSGCLKHMTGNLKLLINFVWKFLGTVHFGNDHIAAILGYGDLQWGNILITRVYFIEGLGHNLFSIGQLCDSDLEVAFRRNTCFVRNLKGVHLLKENRTTNLYTINLHEMAYASPICLIAHATSTKSCKKASHTPKPVPNSKQRLHLLHMDLCGLIRVEIINEKRYVLVIMDDYSRYTWVHFLISKDEAPEEIKTFLKKIIVILQALVIVNDHEDIGKLGAMGDIGFLLVILLLPVLTDSGCDLTYASSTITSQNLTEHELDLLFEAMYDDYIGGQPSVAPRTTHATSVPQVLQTPTASTTTADTTSTPTNSSSQAADIPNTSQDVDELKPEQQHVQQLDNQAQL